MHTVAPVANTAEAQAAATAAAVEVIATLSNRTQEKDVAKSLPTAISLRNLESTAWLVIRIQLR